MPLAGAILLGIFQDAPAFEERWTISNLGNVRAVAYSRDGKFWAVTDGLSVRLYESGKGEPRILKGHTSSVYSLAFSDSELASGDSTHTIRTWEAATGKEIRVLQSDHDDVFSLAYSPNGKLLASSAGMKKYSVSLWKSESPNPHSLLGHTNTPRAVAFSPNGVYFASAGEDATCIVWKFKDGEPSRCADLGHSKTIHCIAFSSDSKLLVTAGNDRSVLIWDVEQKEKRRVLEGHEDQVFSVAFSPEGTLLASSDDDGVILIWNVANWSRIATLKHGGCVRSIAFGPDGRSLLSGSSDGTCKLWVVKR